jgi:hypothetical protein
VLNGLPRAHRMASMASVPRAWRNGRQ